MSSNTEDLAKQLNKYNWSGDKDYQLAVIAFREILEAHDSTLKAEYEEKVKRLTVERDGWRKRAKAWRRDIGELEVEYLKDVEEKVRQARLEEVALIPEGLLHYYASEYKAKRKAELNTPKEWRTIVNVANKDLCAELHELSGWKDVETYWEFYPVSGELRLKYSAPGNTIEQSLLPDYITPAYSLGYLLRKLPEHIPYNGGELPIRIEPWIAGGWWAHYGRYDLRSAIADTPEDALCKLAIELFRQGVLKKGVNNAN